MRWLILLVFLPVMAAAELHHVEINGMKFVPETIEIRAGDEIVWENKDIVPHTVTAENKSFDSKELNPGKEFKHKFKRAGEITYKCSLHPMMASKIIVKKK